MIVFVLKAFFLFNTDWIRSLAVSFNNSRLLSGCVSSAICGWDVETGSKIFRIDNAHQHPDIPDLNTINSLKVFIFSSLIK